MMIRTLIVDDEPLARARIRTLLAGEADVEIIGECENGLEAIESIQADAPDLVFLDVQMPSASGFEVVDAIGPGKMPPTIFVTAYDEFALRAFEAQALDYLLKPFSEQRFRQTLDRARQHVQSRNTYDVQRALASLMRNETLRPNLPQRIIVRTGSRISFVDVEAIHWIEAEGNYVRLHVGGASHLARETLSGLEARLDPRTFLRIHRSTIVNIRQVKHLESLFQGEYMVVLQDGTKLVSSRSYRMKLEQTFSLLQ